MIAKEEAREMGRACKRMTGKAMSLQVTKVIDSQGNEHVTKEPSNVKEWNTIQTDTYTKVCQERAHDTEWLIVCDTDEFIFPMQEKDLVTALKDYGECASLGVNWKIFGHPPQTFMTPHFDFHFYMLSGEEVMAIDCQDVTMPDPAIVPEGYVLPDEYIPEMELMLVGLCVPEMGMHAVNAEESAAEEFFDGTMIVGYIHGKTIFVEPMIAKHTLMRRQDFDIVLPDMGDRGSGLTNPADFMAYYDAENDAFNLTFTMASAD